ncbi:aldehyde dehydrogenase family protein [Rhodobacterales bacterium HKCCE3408]|nr:aldehyde dehydrogenase family protein [Rhodobacterales bacterium HKCCE3408]
MRSARNCGVPGRRAGAGFSISFSHVSTILSHILTFRAGPARSTFFGQRGRRADRTGSLPREGGDVFEAGLIIGGQSLAASDGATFERRGPGAPDVVTRAAAATAEDALQAAGAAAAAFADWSARPPEDRAAFFPKISEALAARRDAICAAARDELGATPSWIDFNIEVAQEMLSEAARTAAALGNRPAGTDPDGRRHLVRREPVGVVLGIAPWNAPVTLGVRAVAAPIALGNTAVMKGSELCPRTHELVIACFADAGLPTGVVNFLTSAPDQADTITEALIAHPAVRRVNFTGSTRVGRLIAMQAARHLKRCVLELSGKAPVIVLEDADLAAAARDVAFGAFFNAGQICMSTDCVIVPESIADTFAGLLVAEAEAIARQTAPDGGPWQGSLISAEAGQRLRALLADAEQWGARILTGGTIDGTEMAPTVVDGVTSAARIYREEVFGPLVSMIRVTGEDEALSVANDSEFGLSAAIFSADIDRALRLAERIESGICHVNGPTVSDNPAMPFGGLKTSGYGRLGGDAAIEEFTELRWLTVRPAPRQT